MRAKIIHWLTEAFAAAAEHLQKPSSDIVIIIKDGGEHADFACSTALMLAKKWRLSPIEIAKLIANYQQPAMFASVTIANPGFININLAKSFVAEALQTFNCESPDFKLEPSRVVIDYSSPNLAKALHVGHIRTSLLGDALVRINEYVGHTVIRQNHVGDWGTQFGMIIAYCQAQTKTPELTTIAELEQIYLKAKIAFDNEPDFPAKARESVLKLQEHQPSEYALWQQFRAVSLAHCQALYNKLELKLLESDVVGESFYQERMPAMLEEIQPLLIESDGALCFFSKLELGKDQQPMPLILKKQDGAFLYATTDLAALQYRVQTLKANKILYVVDQRQSLHFKLLFELAETCNWGEFEPVHVGYGTVNDANGKPFKTRDGGTIKLTDLIAAASSKASELVQAKNPDLPQAKLTKLSATLALAALKYNDLSKPRTTDYAFCYEQMLKFDGNTAPYILYAYVRLNRIAKKHTSPNFIYEAEIEFQLAKKLLLFFDTVLYSANTSMPHYLTSYLYELAVIAMKFYEQCPINSAHASLKVSRQSLANLVCQTLQQGLSLLGIPVVKEM